MSVITTPEMECALANWFDYRMNLIVPNVHWGLNMHECDLLIVSKAGYCTEVEIKISRADLRADKKKRHGHRCARIKYLYFAVPEKLEAAAIEFAPSRAGIITVKPSMSSMDPRNDGSPRCKRIREPIVTVKPQPMPDSERYKVARLGALRIWGLKWRIAAREKDQSNGR